MRVLIFDTNAFVQDFRMDGHSFSVLLSNMGAVADLVVLPRVVLAEAANKYQQAIDSVSKDVRNLSRRTSRLLGNDFEFVGPDDLALARDNYADFIVERLGKKCRVVGYPNVSHEKLVDRAVSKRKPFKESGSGYRDALIWESVLEVLAWEDAPNVIFVTQNRKDFLAEEGLAQDLLNDLVERNVNPNRIETFLGVDDLTKERILPHLDQLDELKAQIEADGVPGIVIATWLEDAAFDEVDKSEVANLLVGLDPAEGADVELSEVYDVRNINVEQSYIVAEGEQFLIMNAVLGVGLNVCANWVQYEESEAIERLFDSDGTGQPAPYACVYVGGEVLIRFSILVHSYEPFEASMEILSTEEAPVQEDA